MIVYPRCIKFIDLLKNSTKMKYHKMYIKQFEFWFDCPHFSNYNHMRYGIDSQFIEKIESQRERFIEALINYIPNQNDQLFDIITNYVNVNSKQSTSKQSTSKQSTSKFYTHCPLDENPSKCKTLHRFVKTRDFLDLQKFIKQHVINADELLDKIECNKKGKPKKFIFAGWTKCNKIDNTK